MAKKILSVLVAVLMVASMATMAIGTASAASPSFSGGTIYWECPWDVAKIAYCHVYGHDGTGLYDWQTKNEKMTKVEGNTWKYDIPAGQFDEVIFSIDTGAQTYDLVLTDDNIGDTAISDTNTPLENPMDSNKTGSKTTWKSGKNGPHLGITSIGNIVGEVLCPTESGADMVANFIKNYLSIQPEYVTAEALSAAMQKAGTNGDEVVAVLETMSDFTMLDEAKTLLGVGGGNSGENNNSSSNSGENNNSSSSNSGSTSSTSSTSSTRSNTSTTSTTSSGTTTTGDSTPFVVLGIVLVAALGVAVVAAKKKVAE